MNQLVFWAETSIPKSDISQVDPWSARKGWLYDETKVGEGKEEEKLFWFSEINFVFLLAQNTQKNNKAEF